MKKRRCLAEQAQAITRALTTQSPFRKWCLAGLATGVVYDASPGADLAQLQHVIHVLRREPKEVVCAKFPLGSRNIYLYRDSEWILAAELEIRHPYNKSAFRKLRRSLARAKAEQSLAPRDPNNAWSTLFRQMRMWA